MRSGFLAVLALAGCGGGAGAAIEAGEPAPEPDGAVEVPDTVDAPDVPDATVDVPDPVDVPRPGPVDVDPFETVLPDVPEKVPLPPCAPTCEVMACGPDGCGQSCGTCDAGKCLGGVCHTACEVPIGPRGKEPGLIMPNLLLADCEGNPVFMDDYCGVPYLVAFNYCGWCPWSVAHATLAQQLQETYRDQGVRFVMVYTRAADGSKPTTTQCQALRAKYGLGFSVLYDPKGAWEATFTQTSDNVLVLTSEEAPELKNIIHAKGWVVSFKNWLQPILDALVGAP